MTRATASISLAVLLGAGWAQQSACAGSEPPGPERLRSEIEALKPASVAWRAIEWKSCLLDGLEESRETGKPLLLWIFIDRPADDGRC